MRSPLPEGRRCARCGSANLFHDDAQVLTCLMCGEPVGAEPPPLLPIWGSRALEAGTRTWRCRTCGARLWRGETRRVQGGFVCRAGCA